MATEETAKPIGEVSILERWQRLEATMDAVRVSRACREAVRTLEVIIPLGGEAGRNAAAGIERVLAALGEDVNLDDESAVPGDC